MDPHGLLVSIAFQFIIAGIVTAFVIGRVRPVEWLGPEVAGLALGVPDRRPAP